MRTENIHGFSSILLAFAIVLSMAISITLTATPVLAQVIHSHPGGTTINVVQGQTFTLTHSLEWNDPANPGYYAITFFWDYTDNANHFTLVENKAYWTDNLDPIEANASFSDDGSKYTIGVASTAGYWDDENITVDITLRAAGPDGTPHAVGTHAISYVIIRCREGIEASAYPADVTINVQAWTGGVVVEGKDDAYSSDETGIPPFIFYVPDNRPPIMAAEKIGSGAVVATGLSATCRNTKWNAGANTAPYLDILLDKAFKWMVTGAENVLWYDSDNIYINTSRCSDLIDNLTTLGYTVWGDNTEQISDLNLDNVDILVIPQLQYGDGPSGGDPSLLSTADVSHIVSFVNDGGGLLIMDGSDAFGHTYNKVHNKILAALGFSWWFQHDSVYDDVNKWNRNYEEISYVDPATAIGAGYKAVTETENLGTYSICSLAPVPTFSADVTILPDDQSAGAGEEVTFVATVHNDGTAWDTYTLDLSDDLAWPELSFLPRLAGELTMPIGPPTDDSHVSEYFSDNVADGGVDYNMYVGWEGSPYAAEGWKTRAYLRFDVSSSPAVISATFNAKVNYGPSEGYPGYAAENMLVDVKAVSGDAWLENELTWNNAPAVGATLDTTMVYDDTTAGKMVWYSWDVTSFVTSELAGDGIVSLCMLSENKEADNNDCTVWFYTKDSSDPPYIEVTYFDPAPPPVTTKTVTLGPCQSENFDLGVTIDPASSYCTRDTLTIDATSAYTETVVGSGSATAHSLGPELTLRGVTVDIHPDNQEAVLVIDRDAVKKRYDPLTFKVIVTNTGDLWDKYVITATTESDKMLELWPTELFLQPDQSDFVVLSVTVPEDEVGDTYNDITVTATGTFATFTGDDMNNAAGEDTCTVHIQEAYCVRVDVWPFQVQSATPGSKVRWIARVKNLGNTTNFYGVTATATVSDYQVEYEIPVNVDLPYVELPPCSWEQVVIDLDIPGDLEMSTRIYVTVVVDSVLEVCPDCIDVAEVEVHVVRGIPLIPQGVIKLEVETEIIAIQVSQTYWDFGVLDEAETAETTGGYFTVRNIGNKNVAVTITGNDAKSSPGELVTSWDLEPTTGLDRYTMWYGTPPTEVLTTMGSPLVAGALVPSEEYSFDLKIETPSSITVPSRMWTLVNLTAVEA